MNKKNNMTLRSYQKGGCTSLSVILLVAVSFVFCYFDATPPTAERLAEYEPLLSVNGRGFTPNLTVYVRYWDSSGARTAGLQQNYKIDSNGEFIFSIPLQKSTATGAIWVIVDENSNNQIGVGDVSCLRNNISFSTASPGNFVTFNRTGDCANMTQVADTFPAANAHTEYTCVTSPAGYGLYAPGSNGATRLFDSTNATLTINDWFPLYRYTTDGSGNHSSSAIVLGLPGGGLNWDTICIAASTSFNRTNWSHP